MGTPRKNLLHNEILALPPCPCDTCENFETCKRYKLACETYHEYVMQAIWRRTKVENPKKIPNPIRYRIIFGGDCDERSAAP